MYKRRKGRTEGRERRKGEGWEEEERKRRKKGRRKRGRKAGREIRNVHSFQINLFQVAE